MKTLISYAVVIVLTAGLVSYFWIQNPKIETVSQTETVTVIDTIPGKVITQIVKQKETVTDTIFIVLTETQICSVMVETGHEFVESKNVYEDLPITVRYYFPPQNVFVWEFGDWLKPREIVTIHDPAPPGKRFSLVLGVMAGENAVGVHATGFYKRIGISAIYTDRLMGGLSIKL